MKKKSKLEIEVTIQAFLLLAIIIWHPTTIIGKVIVAVMAVSLLILAVAVIYQKRKNR